MVGAGTLAGWGWLRRGCVILHVIASRWSVTDVAAQVKDGLRAMSRGTALIRLLGFCMTWALAMASVPAAAVTLNDLYETDQPVPNNSRDAAFVEALKTVVVRVSGQR